MRRVGKARTPNNVQSKFSKLSGKTVKRDQKLQQSDGSRSQNAAKKGSSRVCDARAERSISSIDSITASDTSEVYDDMVVHYMDDVKGSGVEAHRGSHVGILSGRAKIDESRNDIFHDLERDPDEGSDDELDSETNKDSASSQGDSFTVDDERIDTAPRVGKHNDTPDSYRVTRTRSDRDTGSLQPKKSKGNLFKSLNRETAKVAFNSSSSSSSQNTKVHHRSMKTEVNDARPSEEEKEIDVWEDASAGAYSLGSDNQVFYADQENSEQNNAELLNEKIEALQERVKKLEEELREVTALEISIYSVVPEHGISAEKLHTPARWLFRLYIYTCKHSTQIEQNLAQRNIVSGLLFAAKSCINEVPRLSFWLSNTTVLREIIAKESKMPKHSGLSGSKYAYVGTEPSKGWKGTDTFLAALEKLQSWIFMRIVESIWSQVLIPLMQSPRKSAGVSRITEKLPRAALGNHRQGNVSMNLWNNAFHEVFEQLCPVRARERDCGCLPVLARMVMEQCIARLDIAMLNAILRESAHQVPADPVSDPIADASVLPIPAGDLSFASGALLKNAVGNWSRLLTDIYGIDPDDSHVDDESSYYADSALKPFCLLNELSDLLMLPKDMLLDQSIREEVCPSIGLTLITKILCNFTPDEFSPDPVPGYLLEELNGYPDTVWMMKLAGFQSINERRASTDSAQNFPWPAPKAFYRIPSCGNLAAEVIDIGGKSRLSSNVPVKQSRGYISDEELEQMDFSLTSMLENVSLPPETEINGGGNQLNRIGYTDINARYELLQEVWLAEK